MLLSKLVAKHVGIAVMVSALTAAIAPTENGGPTNEDDGTGTVHARFDSSAWKNDAAGARRQMATDLVGRGLLIGKMPAEVKALLGPPDGESKGYLSYLIFSGSGDSMHPVYAVRVDFDWHSQRVTDAQLDADLGTGYSATD